MAHDPCATPHLHGHPPSSAAPQPDMASVPLVEVTRGPLVESVHLGRAVVADAAGHVVAFWGGFEAPVYPRSAIKPLQALPLVETGALDAFGLGDEELALACASHTGEPVHTDRITAWLARVGCRVADLACGIHPPLDEATAHALIRAGQPAQAVHNNCSGKHAGMLTTARHRGEPIRGYVQPAHPVQQRILGVLEQMSGQDLSLAPRGIDGCAIPTFGISLGGLAVAMARMADPGALPARRIDAVVRVRRAWGGHPYLVGGREAWDTRLMMALPGKVLVKRGAEGMACAVLPELGLGLALKIADGAGRATGVAVAAILRHLGVIDAQAWTALGELAEPPVHNRNGTPVGVLRPAAHSLA